MGDYFLVNVQIGIIHMHTENKWCGTASLELINPTNRY